MQQEFQISHATNSAKDKMYFLISLDKKYHE